MTFLNAQGPQATQLNRFHRGESSSSNLRTRLICFRVGQRFLHVLRLAMAAAHEIEN